MVNQVGTGDRQASTLLSDVQPIIHIDIFTELPKCCIVQSRGCEDMKMMSEYENMRMRGNLYTRGDHPHIRIRHSSTRGHSVPR